MVRRIGRWQFVPEGIIDAIKADPDRFRVKAHRDECDNLVRARHGSRLDRTPLRPDLYAGDWDAQVAEHLQSQKAALVHAPLTWLEIFQNARWRGYSDAPQRGSVQEIQEAAS